MLTLSALDETQTGVLYAEKMTRDFPPSELKSLNAIVNMMRRGEYDVFSAERDGEAAAYALLYRSKDGCIVLLDYLAVEPKLREQGIGTQLLQALREHYAHSAEVLMIECERPKAAPDEKEARRRIRFYQNAGASMTDVRVWLFDVEYSIMVLPCRANVSPRDWAWQILELYRQMLPESLFRQNVRLIRG